MANRRFIDFPIASTVGDNDIVLIWQDGANKQTTKATILSGLPENLDELNDVVISGLTNGQILRYDSVTGKWVNTDQGNLDLNDLNDVSIVSPSNGQVLVYNSSTSKWENSSGGFVPYVGAVTTVDLGAQGLRAGYVRFDTSVVTVPDEQGLMYWDASRSTAALIMNGTLQHIGQDSFFYVKNSSGSTIPKGTCVGFAGTDGGSGHLLVTPFLANGSVPSTYFMGVTCESIANGSFGQVMHFGELEGINTSGFTAGALLYASSTVAGAFQTTPPVAPNNIILVAAAVNSKNNGAIVVRPTYGSNINTDEGVKITSPTTGDLLQLQAGGLWENKTLAQVIGSAYVPSTRTLTINGTAFDLSANRSWTVGDVRTDGSYSNPSWITALAWSKITGTPTTLSGYGITDAVPNSRTITINGVTQDLSANRSFNVGTVTSVGLSSSTSGVTIGSTPVTSSGTITLAIATASGSQQGLLSAADWTTFNNKQNALTNPVTGTGTTNYLPKFTGSTTIGNSILFESGNSIGIGTITPQIYTNYSVLEINNTTGGAIRVKNTASSGLFELATNSSETYIKNVSNTPMWFGTNNTQILTLTTSGNLLVGTTSDSGFRLNVNGNAYANTLTLGSLGLNVSDYNFYSQTISGAMGILGHNLRASASVANQVNVVNSGWFSSMIKMYYSEGITFHTSTTSYSAGDVYPMAATERMRVSFGGNLLVGTTSDNGARLQVSGNATFSGAYGTSSGIYLSGSTYGMYGANRGITNASAGIQYFSVGSQRWFTGIYENSDNFGIYSVGTGGFPLILNYSNGAATFSSSVTAGGTLTANTGTGATFRAVFGGTNVIEVGNYNATDGYRELLLSGSPISFYTSNAGASSVTERMRITSGGRLLLGLTSDFGYLLSVNGTSYFQGDSLFNSNVTSSRYFNTSGPYGTSQANARNHFTQFNAGNATLDGGWISGAFGDTLGNRIVIGQYQGAAVIAGHNGNLDNWANMSLATGGGNVLIGTLTDNGQKLQVNGAGKFNGTVGATSALNVFKTDNSTIGAQFAYDSAINQLYLWNFISSGYFSIYTNSAERFRISSSGFVSAGETTNGRLGVRGFTNDSSGYAFEAANASGNSLFLVRNDGFVGINTVPQKAFEALSSINDFVSVGVNSLGVGQWTGIHFGYRENNTSYRKSAIVFERTDLTANDAQGRIHILNGPQASAGSATLSNARLTIAENGNVLINTLTDTGDRLRVNGSIRTANTTNRTADSWRLGDARIDTIPNANRLLRVQIGSVEYDILARQVI